MAVQTTVNHTQTMATIHLLFFFLLILYSESFRFLPVSRSHSIRLFAKKPTSSGRKDEAGKIYEFEARHGPNEIPPEIARFVDAEFLKRNNLKVGAPTKGKFKSVLLKDGEEPPNNRPTKRKVFQSKRQYNDEEDVRENEEELTIEELERRLILETGIGEKRYKKENKVDAMPDPINDIMKDKTRFQGFGGQRGTDLSRKKQTIPTRQDRANGRFEKNYDSKSSKKLLNSAKYKRTEEEDDEYDGSDEEEDYSYDDIETSFHEEPDDNNDLRGRKQQDKPQKMNFSPQVDNQRRNSFSEQRSFSPPQVDNQRRNSFSEQRRPNNNKDNQIDPNPGSLWQSPTNFERKRNNEEKGFLPMNLKKSNQRQVVRDEDSSEREEPLYLFDNEEDEKSVIPFKKLPMKSTGSSSTTTGSSSSLPRSFAIPVSTTSSNTREQSTGSGSPQSNQQSPSTSPNKNNKHKDINPANYKYSKDINEIWENKMPVRFTPYTEEELYRFRKPNNTYLEEKRLKRREEKEKKLELMRLKAQEQDLHKKYEEYETKVKQFQKNDFFPFKLLDYYTDPNEEKSSNEKNTVQKESSKTKEQSHPFLRDDEEEYKQKTTNYFLEKLLKKKEKKDGNPIFQPREQPATEKKLDSLLPESRQIFTQSVSFHDLLLDHEFIQKEYFSENSHSNKTTNSFIKKSFMPMLDQVIENLETKMHISIPTKIQENSIPLLSIGQNTILHAQTGSGKTLAFLLPLLYLINPSLDRVQAIILAPSRELVLQISKVANQLFDETDLRCLGLIGGANIKTQLKTLREVNPQIVVATPGRLAEILFHFERLSLNHVNVVIIDEADHLVQEPFIKELKTIMDASNFLKKKMEQKNEFSLIRSKLTTGKTSSVSETMNHKNETNSFKETTETTASAPEEEKEKVESNDDPSRLPSSSSFCFPQKHLLCLASATANNNPFVTSFIEEYSFYNQFHHLDLTKQFSPNLTLNKPPPPSYSKAIVNQEGRLPPTITHAIISVPLIKRYELLKKFLNAKPEVNRGIIFVNDPYKVQQVYEKLLSFGFIVAPLHGDTNKEDRKDILQRLQDGRLRLVITTELSARGLDIPDVTHVINFELPTDANHYIHRVGRCGRVGKAGLALSLTTPQTKFVIRRFAKQLGTKIHDCEIREGQVWLKKA
jgi:superfamily II DNA/RNA helicase